MAYAPKNLQIFTAAFAGALAGMGLSDRVISDSNSATYAGVASVAGAFAQAVDTAWTIARATSLLDVEAVQSNSAAFWENRSPNASDTQNVDPATWAAAALALIATITASESYFTAQGIVPPAIPGSPTTPTTTVANLTELAAVNISGFQNGIIFYVRTLRSWFILSLTGTETADGITVITALGGMGRWLRLVNLTSPTWLYVNNWYIDATSGDDENNGQAAASAAGNVGPLKTYGELARRWNDNIIRPTAVTGSQFLCTVNFLTTLPNTDPVYSACSLGPTVILRLQGKAETVLYSGAFTTVTARNPAANAATILGDTAIGSPTTYLNRRWRNTTVGARLNQCGWIQKDLGGTNFRSSTPQVLNSTSVTDPVVGDTYNIETLTTVSMGDLSNFMIQAGATASGAQLQLRELAIRASGFTSVNFNTPGSGSVNLFTCDFQTNVNFFAGLLQRAFNCQFQQGMFIGASLTELNAGVTNAALASANGLVNHGTGAWTLSNGFMCQGVNMKGGGYNILDACVFDCPNNTANNGGHGILLGKSQSSGVQQPHSLTGWLSMDTRLWGSGNAGVGVYVGAGCQFNYAAGTVANITITGTGGDFKLNGKTTANVWDQTALAGTGAYLAPRNCTWANLAATVATTGFGGFANDVESGARIASAAAA